MSEPRSKLNRHIQRIQRLIDRQSAHLARMRDYRMWCGLLGLGLIVYSSYNQWTLGLGLGSLILLFGFPVFVYLTNRAASELQNTQSWQDFIRRHQSRKKAQWNELPKSYRPDLVSDLDIFGHPSLMGYLDETISESGENQLASLLETKPASAQMIIRDQKYVLELSRHPHTLRSLLLHGWRMGEQIPSARMADFVKKSVVREGFSKRFVVGLSLWILAVALYCVHMLEPMGNLPSLAIMAYWIYTVTILGELAQGFQAALGIEKFYSKLAGYLKHIEKADSAIFKDICPKLQSEKPSGQLKHFGRVVSYLSIQGNPIIFMVVNALLPWTLFFTWLLERSRTNLAQSLPTSLEELGRLETFWCRSYLYIFHTRTFPTINNEPGFQAKELSHPLISDESVIANDFGFDTDTKVGLITGSNMSGKSTFLRTVGINQVLANSASPVFAKELHTWPASVQSCLRVSDSIEDGFSYFYAEVRRIRSILNELETGQSVLFLIDEVFKGTNNRERLIAAKSLLTRLIEFDSLGLVTTHDLELSELAQSLAEIRNFHFSDDFAQGEMTFDYTIKDGPCQSTNALRILEKEGLPVLPTPH